MLNLFKKILQDLYNSVISFQTKKYFLIVFKPTKNVTRYPAPIGLNKRPFNNNLIYERENLIINNDENDLITTKPTANRRFG